VGNLFPAGIARTGRRILGQFAGVMNSGAARGVWQQLATNLNTLKPIPSG